MTTARSHKKRIAWFVSGHGLGHATRATQIMRRIPADIADLIVFSVADGAFIRREARRRVTLIPRAWDHGPVQASDFAIDWDATFTECIAKQRAVAAGHADTVRLLRDRRVDLVVTDIAPAPLRAARDAGIPAVCVVNFTWCDVLGPHTGGRPERERLIADYRDAYRAATLTLRTPLSFAMPYMPNLRDIDLVAARATGPRRRRELARAVGAAPTDKLVVIYLGLWGTDTLRLDRAAATSRGIRFISYRPIGSLAATVDPDRWPFDELIATADALLCKPGYGSFSSSMANAVPCVYYPRTEFAEYTRLRGNIDTWGGAVRMNTRDFMNGNWRASIDRALTLTPPHAPANGAEQAASAIINLLT